MPSSAATSTAPAVRSFVTDAQRKLSSRGPWVAIVSPSRITPAAARDAPQPSIAASASTSDDTTAMERHRVFSGSPYERIMGYCRAVRVGDRVFVAGTAPIMPDGADPPAEAYGQTKRCLEIVAAALGEAGSGLEDVVRTRGYLVGPEHFDAYARAHGEAFSEIKPVNTTVVASLLDPRWLVEIEAEAVTGAVQSR